MKRRNLCKLLTVIATLSLASCGDDKKQENNNQNQATNSETQNNENKEQKSDNKDSGGNEGGKENAGNEGDNGNTGNQETGNEGQNPVTHDYSITYTWSTDNKCTATRIDKLNPSDVLVETKVGVYTMTSPADCTNAEHGVYKVSFENSCFSPQEKEVTVGEPVGHQKEETWSSNETTHFHSTTCGHDMKFDEANHTFENGVCTVCQYVNESIVNYNTVIDSIKNTADYMGSISIEFTSFNGLDTVDSYKHYTFNSEDKSSYYAYHSNQSKKSTYSEVYPEQDGFTKCEAYVYDGEELAPNTIQKSLAESFKYDKTKGYDFSDMLDYLSLVDTAEELGFLYDDVLEGIAIIASSQQGGEVGEVIEKGSSVSLTKEEDNSINLSFSYFMTASAEGMNATMSVENEVICKNGRVVHMSETNSTFIHDINQYVEYKKDVYDYSYEFDKSFYTVDLKSIAPQNYNHYATFEKDLYYNDILIKSFTINSENTVADCDELKKDSNCTDYIKFYWDKELTKEYTGTGDPNDKDNSLYGVTDRLYISFDSSKICLVKVGLYLTYSNDNELAVMFLSEEDKARYKFLDKNEEYILRDLLVTNDKVFASKVTIDGKVVDDVYDTLKFGENSFFEINGYTYIDALGLNEQNPYLFYSSDSEDEHLTATAFPKVKNQEMFLETRLGAGTYTLNVRVDDNAPYVVSYKKVGSNEYIDLTFKSNDESEFVITEPGDYIFKVKAETKHIIDFTLKEVK